MSDKIIIDMVTGKMKMDGEDYDVSNCNISTDNEHPSSGLILKLNYRESKKPEYFGMREIEEYEKTCTSPKILIIIRKLKEARSKNSLWCNRISELEAENKKLKEKPKISDSSNPIPIALYHHADANGKFLPSESCVCEDDVYTNSDDDDSIGIPLVRLSDALAAIAKEKGKTEMLKGEINETFGIYNATLKPE